VETIRQAIREFLMGGPRTLRDISQELRISEKEALGHLEHIARARGHGRLGMDPAQCNSCGYEFRKRGRLGKPGRCPVCKSESISQPRYYIK
jgi:transcriptional regulator